MEELVKTSSAVPVLYRNPVMVNGTLFKIAPLKLLADGNLGNRISSSVEPYSDDASTIGNAKFT